jgi:uncharacterized protein YyaL (SSP411 family)
MAPADRLSRETSPYLLQHAGNPVDWYPWGEEAFARARAEGKPVFLSVGYAACHWCHVMERESFEDAETAAMLNAGFVSIKVDREERPDVDAIYMDAVQALTGAGGWPMSAFLTPDGKPFYAGTYFPDEPRHGMPSFRQVLRGIAEAWADRRDQVALQGDQVATAVARAAGGAAAPTSADAGLADAAFVALKRSFDPTWGGFGGAPKFPQPMVLEWLLRQHVRGRAGALDMVRITLDRMAAGGIHDQVGGGFARYSTDARWHVPHFEKMLSDNAQLLQVYTHAWLVTREDRYREVAVRTADYLVREMQQVGGGFSTSQDADSEGVEGKFFVWDWGALVGIVGEPVARALGATLGGNWDGTNVLWMPSVDDRSLPEVAAERASLFAARELRVRPAVDDKVIAGWNGLAIRALVVAGRALEVPSYVQAASDAAMFVWGSMLDEEGRLLRSWRAGSAHVAGFLDDHALLGLGLLTLYETTGDVVWFERATLLGAAIRERFTDPIAGGFFLTADDADALFVRPKELLDTAVPSGNAAAAELLVRLGLYTGDAELEAAATRAVELVLAPAREHPSAFGHALNVADMLIGPRTEIAIVGLPDSEPRARLIREVVGRYLPNAVLAIGDGADPSTVGRLPLLRDKVSVNGQATAYVCERFVCRAPVVDPPALGLQLGSAS